MKEQTPRERAYDLYFKTNLTQAQIAERAGVSTRTLYDWMKQGNWKTLKANSRLMPAQIVDDIYNHISHLNWKIKTRDFEDRYPSKEEAETLRKLICTIPKIKLNVSKGESAQAMINFVSWLQTRNNDAAIFISDFIDEYLHAGREKGLEPYEFEYDADQYYNPTDYPWRQSQTFEERTSEEAKSPLPPSLHARPFDGRGASQASEQRPDDISGKQPRQNTDHEAKANEAGQESSPPYFQGGVPAEPNDALAGGGGSPLAPEKEARPEAPEQNQKDPHPELVSGPHENTDNLAPDTPLASLRGTKQPRQNTDNLAPDNQQKQEPNQNQTGSKSEAVKTSDNPTKRPDHQAPDLKKLPKPTSENKIDRKPEEATNDDIRDRIQKVFASWQKEIDKNKRRRR